MKTKFILLSLIIITCFSLKAQTITIPDTHFVSWLSINIPSAMTGNQLDTSSLDVKTMMNMNIANDSIEDLSGIQYFTGLRSLNCSYNQIRFIPEFPDSLTYLDCSHNYLDSIPQLPFGLVTLNCSINSLYWLQVLPDSLTELTCTGNQLDSLPSLPMDMTSLACGNNMLTFLPVLPDSLQELNCSWNLLTALPLLPASLTVIRCEHNQISALPVLPALTIFDCGVNLFTNLPPMPPGLIEYYCDGNQLSFLLPLPDSLQILVCGNNSLTALPVLPSTLLNLRCYNNQISVLPALPASLQYLDCSYNLLNTIPVFSSDLSYINCSNNQINILPSLTVGLSSLNCSYNVLANLPVLPSSLQFLNCGANPLIDLPALNSGLVVLDCSNDGLDSIPSLPSSLQALYCSYNILDTLYSLPAGLSRLECTNNYLSELPLLPSSLNHLNCNYNLIESLPVLPVSLNSLNCSNNQIKCFSAFSFNIEQLDIYNNLFTCLPNYIVGMDSVILDYPLCIDGDFANNPYGCESAQGILGFSYLDNNTNCTRDSIDSQMPNIPVKLYDNSGTFISGTNTASNGVYNFSFGSGAYIVKIDTLNLPFRPLCNTPGVDSAVSITSASPLVSDINFDFGCKPGFDIGTRSVITEGWVFPGQIHEMKVIAGDMSQWYNMHCAAGVSGIVKITVNGPVTYNGSSSGSLLPAILGNEYTYSIADFGTVNINQAFGLLFKVDTTAAAGADICVHVEVTPAGGDNKPNNNLYNFCYQVVNSHDPNLKEVYPGELPPRYKGYLTYTIHFQNTGNAPAMNIRLADTLDEHLDPATFQLLNYSHANTYSLNGNILSVRFADIMLPDSSTDLQGSQGYIQYKIKVKDYYPAFTQIHNTAYIYFDYNEAVVTNTTTNEIMEATGLNEEMPVDNLNVYPNPGKGLFNIDFSETNVKGDTQILVYDLLGNVIMDMKINSSSAKIDLNDQANGIYILKVIRDNSIITKRLVKQ